MLYQGLVTAIVAALFLNTLNNLRLLRRPAQRPPPASGPLVSVLVPARDEARSIGPCVEALARQDYPWLEVLVLDDQSEDQTAAIVEDLARRFARVRLLRGLPLPPEWHGKAYACAQLAQAARGEWLLFVDADTILAPACVSTTLAVAIERRADLLTMMPRVLAESFGEALLLPAFSLTFGTLLPMGIVTSRRFPQVAAALGPYLLFRREIYRRVGGHEAVRTDIVEDMKLAQLVKRHGGRLVWLDGTDLARVRFYHGFGEAWRGIAKSTFTALDYSLPSLFLGLAACFAIFLAPYIFVIDSVRTHSLTAAFFWLPLGQIALDVLAQLIVAWRFRMRRAMAFLHAGAMLALILLTLDATYQATLGEGVAWKGRTYQFQPQTPSAVLRAQVAAIVPFARLALALMLIVLGWRGGGAVLAQAAMIPLLCWSGALIEHALDSSSESRVAALADVACGFASVAYLQFSGLVNGWLMLGALAIVAFSARQGGWHAAALAASIGLGSALVLVAGVALPSLHAVILLWVTCVALLSSRAIAQTLSAWFERLRSP